MTVALKEKEVAGWGIKVTAETEDGREVGRAYLYVLRNDLHREPFGFLEDVWVNENCRGQGIFQDIMRKIIALARMHGCYKIVATSRYDRPRVHKLYERLGFADYGVEFRMNLQPT